LTYEVKTWFQHFTFQIQLVPLHPGMVHLELAVDFEFPCGPKRKWNKADGTVDVTVGDWIDISAAATMRLKCPQVGLYKLISVYP
jgi:hypothetical protein